MHCKPAILGFWTIGEGWGGLMGDAAKSDSPTRGFFFQNGRIVGYTRAPLAYAPVKRTKKANGREHRSVLMARGNPNIEKWDYTAHISLRDSRLFDLVA
jgi:hypothetical protein